MSRIHFNMHESHAWNDSLDFFVEPVDKEGWLECPNCDMLPKVWVFDNGRSTSCGCWTSQYDHFSIYAESIMSVARRSRGSVADYDNKGLMKNWNQWVETGQILFEHKEKRSDGRW